MRAIVIDGFGGPEAMRLGEEVTPEPGPGEVLVAVSHVGLNPADWKTREGWLAPFFDYEFPFVLGFDLAGTVAVVGEGVDGLTPGDRVVAYSKVGMGQWGSYAEYAVTLAVATVPLPECMDLAAAAALPTAGMTAWEAVFDTGDVRSGSRVLVNGGAGGLGSYAIQLARHAGAAVAATCSAANAEYVRGLGADLAIDYRDGGVLDAVRAWAPDGVDLVVDAVGQGTLRDAVEVVRPGGTIAAIATLIADEPSYDTALAAERGVTLAPTMTSYERSPKQLRGLVELSARGALRPPHIEAVPIDRIGAAHARLQDGHVRGKLVLDWSVGR